MKEVTNDVGLKVKFGLVERIIPNLSMSVKALTTLYKKTEIMSHQLKPFLKVTRNESYRSIRDGR